MSTKREATAEALVQVEAWVRQRLSRDGAASHGWLHTDRVRCNIRELARVEGVDPFLAELTALLHDVGRTLPGPESEHGHRSAELAAPLLAQIPLTDEDQEAVLHAVRWHNSKRDDSPLLCILRDADMLDGLGAIGIMRAFMSQGQLPAYKPGCPFDKESVRWPTTTACDQVLGQLKFYEWLNTDTARAMAEQRYSFMLAFVSQLQRELESEDQNP